MRPTSFACLWESGANFCPSRPVIVAFPPAGSGAGFYRFLPQKLEGVRILSVQYPGRESRLEEEFASSREQIVREVCQALETELSGHVGALDFLGHSFGAQVAFESLLKIESGSEDLSHIRPQRLVLSARNAQNLVRHPPLDQENYSDHQLLQWVKALGGTPQEVFEHPELSRMLAKILRADLALSAQEAPAGRCVAQMVLVCGDQDPVASMPSMLSWAQRSLRTPRRVDLQGDHDALRQDFSRLAQVLW